VRFARQQESDFPLTFIPGVELTHVAPRRIAPLAQRAKELGAGLVLVHGETISEPVRPGTNRAAVECPAVDILAHPGLITLEEAPATWPISPARLGPGWWSTQTLIRPRI
jgi:histidinol phosphatase-like PHP family hydrolase